MPVYVEGGEIMNLNSVAGMASNYYKSFQMMQSQSESISSMSGSKVGDFNSVSGLNTSSTADMTSIAKQYDDLRVNRTSIKQQYEEMTKSSNFSVKDFINSGNSASQVSSSSQTKLPDITAIQQSQSAGAAAGLKPAAVDQDQNIAEKIAASAKQLTASANALTKTGDQSLFKAGENGQINMDNVAAAVSDFVNNYNSTIQDASKSGNANTLQKVGNLMNQSASNYNNLSKVGITVETSGKLSLNTEKLSGASTSDLKTMFEGNDSYAQKVANLAENVTQAAQSSQYKTYSTSGVASFSFANTLGNFVNYSA